MSSGGKREGSGRKKIYNDSTTLSLRISAQAKEYLSRCAKDEGVSMSQWLDTMIKKLQEWNWLK